MVIRKSPRNAPAVTIRFRTKTELGQVKRAARLQGLSLNTMVANAASVAAEQIIRQFTEQQQSTLDNNHVTA